MGEVPMVLYSYATRELTAKVVYYGPGLSGKTTNLQALHDRLDKGATGRLLSLATSQDRTIYFDLLPVELGNIKGNKVRFQLCTVPGQVFYNETRKIVLKGVDGIVFVVDSQWSMLSHCLESYQNLLENLRLGGLAPERIPLVVQYNKRDLPGILSVEALQDALSFRELPFVEAVASEGKGVVETFRLISKMTFVDLIRRLARPVREAARPDETTPGRWAAAIPPPPPPFPGLEPAPEPAAEEAETADTTETVETTKAAGAVDATETAETVKPHEGLHSGPPTPITYEAPVDSPPTPIGGDEVAPEPLRVEEPFLSGPEEVIAPAPHPTEIGPFDEPPPPPGPFTFEPPPPWEPPAHSEPPLFPTEETPVPAPVLEDFALPPSVEQPAPPPAEAADATEATEAAEAAEAADATEAAAPSGEGDRLEELEKRIEALERALSSLRLALAPLASFTGEVKGDGTSVGGPQDPGDR